MCAVCLGPCRNLCAKNLALATFPTACLSRSFSLPLSRFLYLAYACAVHLTKVVRQEPRVHFRGRGLSKLPPALSGMPADCKSKNAWSVGVQKHVGLGEPGRPSRLLHRPPTKETKRERERDRERERLFIEKKKDFCRCVYNHSRVALFMEGEGIKRDQRGAETKKI